MRLVQLVGMKFRFIGCGDAFGTGGRFNTCFHVEHSGGAFLIDCGASSMVEADLLDAAGLAAIVTKHRPDASGPAVGCVAVEITVRCLDQRAPYSASPKLEIDQSLGGKGRGRARRGTRDMQGIGSTKKAMWLANSDNPTWFRSCGPVQQAQSPTPRARSQYLA